MVNILDNKVLKKIDEIIDYIKDSDTYKRFNIVEEQMSNNEELMSLIKEVKVIQQEIVKREEIDLDTQDLSSLY